jgi:ketosteroid isomerase-like protein
MAPTSPGDLVATLMEQETVEDWIAYLHPDAEYQPLPDAPVYRGLTEIREWARGAIADPKRPEPLPMSLTETADKAVVRGQVRFSRGTGERLHHVFELAAWVVTVSDGKLRRVEAFSSWDTAEKAVGIESAREPRTRRLGRGFQLLRGALRPRRLLPG